MNTLEKVIASEGERGSIATGCLVWPIGLAAAVNGYYMLMTSHYSQEDYMTVGLGVGLLVGGAVVMSVINEGSKKY